MYWNRGTMYKEITGVLSFDSLSKSCGERVHVFTDATIDFLQNMQSCGRNSMQYKIEAIELQEWALPWHRANKGGVHRVDVDKSDSDKEVDFEAMCYEDILMLLEEAVEISAHDEDPEFLKDQLNSLVLTTQGTKDNKAAVAGKMWRCL
jgi:predicted  nucleic acid-binding Zn-ribbon protein